MTPPSKRRDEQTLKLMQHLFARLTAEEGLDPVAASGLLPEYFLAWLQGKVDSFAVGADVADDAGVEPIAWEFMREILANAAGALMIAPLWPMVTLAYRGEPKHPVKSLHAVYLITYEDGHVCPIMQLVHRDLMHGGVITDAFAATQTHQQFRTVKDNVVEHGLDGLYETHSADFGGSNYENFFNLVMGLLLTGIKARPPAERGTLMLWLRLIQEILNRPLPREAAAAAVAPPRESHGGFDF
jgi:hypothetical protein